MVRVRAVLARPSVKLLLGSIIAQVIALITIKLATDFYDPREMGVYTLIFTFIGMAAPVISLRYEECLLLEKDDNDAVSLLVFIAALCLVIGLAFSVALPIYLQTRGEGPPDHLAVLCVLFFITITLTGINNAYRIALTRVKKYNVMSRVSVVRAVLKSASWLGVGFFWPRSPALVAGECMAQAAGLRSQFRAFPLPRDSFAIARRRWWCLARKHYRQPVFGLPAAAVHAYSQAALNFMLYALFERSVLGHVGVAMSALGVPLVVISSNIASLYSQKISAEALGGGNHVASLRSFSLKLLAFAVPFFAGIYFLSPVLLPYFLGPRYHDAIIYIQLLTPFFFFRFIATAVSYGIILTGMQRIDLILQIILAGALATLSVVAPRLGFGPHGLVLTVSIIFSVFYVCSYALLLRCSYIVPVAKSGQAE